MKTTKHRRRKQESDATLVDAPALVPDGEYNVAYQYHQTIVMWGRPRVCIRFAIAEGQFAGLELKAWYRVAGLSGRPRKYGGVKLRINSDLYRQMVLLMQCKTRPDRISLRWLDNCIIKARTRTVTKDNRQKELTEPLQYSVIDELREVVAGSVSGE